MTALEEIEKHLSSFSSAPFLFVGSGVSRRYLGLETWKGLLEHLSSFTGMPYAYYVTSGNGNITRVASAIAEAFHEIWWTDARFEESRAEFGTGLSGRESPFKVEIARHVSAAIARLPAEGPLFEELNAFRAVVIDGIITTNYDPLLEVLFPDFRKFVGQDDLLFADSQGIGEIYKIHGGAEVPESIVITEADFGRFRERNPYLAAKLLTVFVEHPVLFLGYSLSDENVTEILVSVARVLTTDNLSRLQDHLIFVEWDPDAVAPSFTRTGIAVEGFTIPVISVRVANFVDLFAILGRIRRKFPAKLLRQLKEHVYELVLGDDPNNRLFVQDIDSGADLSDIDVVFGIGIQRKIASHGYVGLSRRDLLNDAIGEDTDYNARRIVRESLPMILGRGGHTPIYRYLRDGGFIDHAGLLRTDAEIDQRIVARFSKGHEPLLPAPTTRARALRLVAAAGEDLIKLIEGNSLTDALAYASMIPPDKIDLGALREFLVLNSSAFVGGQGQPTLWAKLVCYYDYLAYGPNPTR